MTTERLEWAQRYIARGWPIFLLNQIEYVNEAGEKKLKKAPLANCQACAPRVEGTCRDWNQCRHLTCHGFYAATTDMDRVEQMLKKNENGLLALRTGQASRIIAIDAEGDGDPKGTDVIDDWEMWARTDWSPPMFTLTQRTGGGGIHLLYRVPEGVEVTSRSRILPQVDVKGDGGYIAIATGAGDGRSWDNWSDEIVDAPPAMLTWLRTTRGGIGLGHGGGGGSLTEDQYREIKTKQWVPGGVREEFYFKFIFELRKAGKKRWEIEDITRLWWDERTEQPPATNYYMPWSDIEYKIERDCSNPSLEPDPLPAWHPAVHLAVDEHPSEPRSELPAVEVASSEDEPVAVAGGDGDDGGSSRVADTLILDANHGGTEHLTDSGNARRFVRLYHDVVRYCKDTSEWFTWNGSYWEPDVDSGKVTALTWGVITNIRNTALEQPDEAQGGGRSPRQRHLDWATTSEGKGHRQRMYELAGLEFEKIRLTQDDLDADPFALVVQNGTLDLRTGVLRSSRSADNNSRCCDAKYIEGASSPLLDQFLETFLPDADDQRFVFALLGHMLRGYNEGRFFPFLLGSTTSGKTQLAQAVLRLLGRYGCSINSSVFRGNLDDKPRPDLVKAIDTRIAVANEASKNWELHGDQVKRLTGGDAIPYRNLYAGMTERRPRFTPLIVANEMPSIKAPDDALKRRMIVIRFDRTIPPDQEDPKIKERFISDAGVMSALLWRLVLGSQDAIAGSLTNIPRKYMLATMEAFDQLDHVVEFLRWMEDSGYLTYVDKMDTAVGMAKSADLHNWYTKWVMKHGDKMDKSSALSLKDFNARLRGMGWESKVSAGTRWLGRQLVEQMPWSMI